MENGSHSYKSEIVSYLKKNLKKGYTKESLYWALIDQGHSKLEIQNAMNQVEKELSQEAPVLKTKPEIRHEYVGEKGVPFKAPEKISFWKKWFSR